jgi:hypothetical protein
MTPDLVDVVAAGDRSLEPRHAGPVLVTGPDRSGTTLMFALLASHPELCMVRRTNLWRWFDGRYGDLADAANLERCLDDLVAYRRMAHLQPDRERLRDEMRDGPATYGRLFELVMRHHAERAGASRWGDKSLHTEHHADRVFAAFPDARMIHMLRDPRDRYASVRRRGGNDVRRVGAAAGRWRASTRAAERNRQRHPDRYLVVRYEDLVHQPETTMRRVCDFIGEDYTPAMLTMGGAPSHREAGANSSFGDVEAGTISTRATGRFHRVLSPVEIACIQVLLGRAMRRVGYPPVPVRLDRGQQLRLLARDLPMHAVRMVGWTVTEAVRRRVPGRRVPAARMRDHGPAGQGTEHDG